MNAAPSIHKPAYAPATPAAFPRPSLCFGVQYGSESTPSAFSSSATVPPTPASSSAARYCLPLPEHCPISPPPMLARAAVWILNYMGNRHRTEQGMYPLLLGKRHEGPRVERRGAQVLFLYAGVVVSYAVWLSPSVRHRLKHARAHGVSRALSISAKSECVISFFQPVVPADISAL